MIVFFLGYEHSRMQTQTRSINSHNRPSNQCCPNRFAPNYLRLIDGNIGDLQARSKSVQNVAEMRHRLWINRHVCARFVLGLRDMCTAPVEFKWHTDFAINAKSMAEGRDECKAISVRNDLEESNNGVERFRGNTDEKKCQKLLLLLLLCDYDCYNVGHSMI